MNIKPVKNYKKPNYAKGFALTLATVTTLSGCEDPFAVDGTAPVPDIRTSEVNIDGGIAVPEDLVLPEGTIVTEAEEETVMLDGDVSFVEETEITEINNWYLDGYVIPKNWKKILTTQEAFSQFDNLNQMDVSKNVEDAIVLLMNRNVLVFNTMHLKAFEFNEDITGLDYNNEDELIFIVNSQYFNYVDDIEKLVFNTYTKDCAESILYGSNENQQERFISGDNGEIFVNLKKTYNWSTEPFEYQTYVELTENDENSCEFIWHYIEWDFWDYNNNRTVELYPHHKEMTFSATKEDSTWKLTSLIFDNPELTYCFSIPQ